MNDSSQLKTEPTATPPPEHDSTFDVPSLRNTLSWFKAAFDYLGASRETPPPGMTFLTSPLWLGLWWGLLLGLILLFCGQTSKFIYIDF